jgi:hypothetical protein
LGAVEREREKMRWMRAMSTKKLLIVTTLTEIGWRCTRTAMAETTD